MANVLVQDTSLTAIADAIRSKNGSSTLYKPADMATAITAIPSGGGSLDFMTNTTDYGSSEWESSSNERSIVLPDAVAFEDIKFLIGIGGFNNASITAADSGKHNIYIYCPDLYNVTIEDQGGVIYHACFGSYPTSYSAYYYQGIDYARGNACYRNGTTYFGWITYNQAEHSIDFYTSEEQSSSGGPFELERGYMLADYGVAAMIYSNGSGT